MKEKIENMFGKVKEFVEDHQEGVILAVYGGWMAIFLGGSLRSLHLANVKTRLEIKALQQK